LKCKEFNEGTTGGNLCQDLCNSHELVIKDCLAHKNTTIVFSGTWKNKGVVFKTKREPHHYDQLKDLIYAGLGGKCRRSTLFTCNLAQVTTQKLHESLIGTFELLRAHNDMQL